MKDKSKTVGLIRRELTSRAQELGVPLAIQAIIIRLVILDYQGSNQNALEAIESGVAMMRNVIGYRQHIGDNQQ